MSASGDSVELFFHHSKNIMFILDHSFRIIRFNPAFTAFAGYTSNDRGLLNLLKLIHEEDQERMRAVINDCFDEGKSIEESCKFRLLNSSGEYSWVSDISSFGDRKNIYITATVLPKNGTGEGKIDATHILNEVVNLVPYPIFLKDHNGKYLLVNQAQSELFSLKAEDLLGKDDSYFIKDPKQYKGVVQSDAAVLEKHIIIDIAEQIITTPDGKRKILHTTKVPLLSPVDGRVFILGVSVDLTDLKKYQEALKQNEEKYRSLVELSPDAIIILKNGKISFINDSGIKLLGAGSMEELLGKKFLDFIHPDYYSVIIERNRLLIRGERVSAIEEKFIKLDGSIIDVEVSSIPFYYEDKFAIQIIARDIHDRVKARNSLFKRKQEFEALAENSSDIIARFNKNHEHLYINKSVSRYTDKLPEYFINRKVSEDYPKSLYRGVEKVIDKVFKKGKTITKYFILPTEQGIQYCLATIVPERDKSNNIISVLCTVRDITELKLKEKELISINKELNTFIYKASHDIKGPLATILGLSKLSRYGHQLEYEEIFSMIHKTASNLNYTLKNLLEIVQVKEGVLNIKKIDLPEMVHDIILDLKNEFDTSSIRFSVDLATMKNIKSDSDILCSIIKNLLRNSIIYKSDHMPFISVTAEHNKGGMIMTVEDNGQGIEENVKSKIFDMFFRGHIRSQGSGLGLYLVKKGISRLKGTIEFESEVNKGSKFSVFIPEL